MDLGNIDFKEIFNKIKDFIGGIDFGEIVDKVKPFFEKVVEFFKNSPSMLLSLVIFLTVMFDPAAGNTDTSILVNEEVKAFLDSVLMTQGVTNDGEYLYTAGSVEALKLGTLAKYDIKTLERKKYEKSVFPDSLKKRGNDRICGISYYDGKIYAGVEASKGDNAYPCIAVFNADSLSYVTHYDLPLSWFPDGVSWVAVNPDTGYLYAAPHADAKSIHEFDIDATMAHVKEIDLTGLGSLSGIKGGEFYEGDLYLSRDIENGNIDEVLSVVIETGEVELGFTRNVGKTGSEATDITVYESDDGAVFHVIDYNKLISVYLRSYITIDDGETEE